MTGKLIAAGLVETSPAFLGTVLVVDLLVCTLLLQGMFLGTRITYGGYGR